MDKKVKVLSVERLSMATNEAFAALWATPLVGDFQAYLRSRNGGDGPRNAAFVGESLEATRGLIVDDIKRIAGKQKGEVRYIEQLDGLCRQVETFVDRLRNNLKALTEEMPDSLYSLLGKISEIYAETTGQIKNSVDLSEDPGVETEVERPA